MHPVSRVIFVSLSMVMASLKLVLRMPLCMLHGNFRQMESNASYTLLYFHEEKIISLPYPGVADYVPSPSTRRSQVSSYAVCSRGAQEEPVECPEIDHLEGAVLQGTVHELHFD